METAAIEVTNLTKTYGSFQAVKGIDIHVERGEIFALLGPNGAGKTTTIEILEGHQDKTAGEVSVLGHDPFKNHIEFRSQIGIVLQETGLDPYLTIEETIKQYSYFYGTPKPIEEVLLLTNLQEHKGVKVRQLSGGLKRRLDVAIGLAGDPELIFLDEPTTGFDPNARRTTWDTIKSLKNIGKTILLTTHYMEEAEELADRIAIMVNGHILMTGTLTDIRNTQKSSNVYFQATSSNTNLPIDLANIAEFSEGEISIATDDPVHVLHQLTNWATSNGIDLPHLSVKEQSLEDIFLSWTQKKP